MNSKIFTIFVVFCIGCIQATKVAKRVNILEEAAGPINAGCQCTTYDCSCCINNIPLLNSICVNLGWDAPDLTIDVSLLVNNIDVYDAKITDPYPLAVCIDYICTVCVDIENLNITDRGGCGRIYLNVSCLGLNQAWDLGQFHLGDDCTVPEIDDGKLSLLASEAAHVIPLNKLTKLVNSKAKGEHKVNPKLDAVKNLKGKNFGANPPLKKHI